MKIRYYYCKYFCFNDYVDSLLTCRVGCYVELLSHCHVYQMSLIYIIITGVYE